MSAQADWNQLVTQLRNNFFKLVFFGLECSGPALNDVFTPDVISSKGTVTSGDSSSDSVVPPRRRQKKISPSSYVSRKKVKRLPSAANKSPATSPPPTAATATKRKRRSTAMPPPALQSLSSQDAVHVITEDVNFQDLLNY
jgi:hypothetical protein